MNKANLKNYAPQARVDFIAAVTSRANLLGISSKGASTVEVRGDVAFIEGREWPSKIATQRDKLLARIKRHGFEQSIEEVAYTWFNRFAALRYMELHDYLGHGHRALSSAVGTLPDILTYAADLAQGGVESGLPGLKAALVTEMKLAGNRDGELYRMLLVAQCNALNVAMPFLFERIDDDTELLLPDNLLRTDSVIAKLVQSIPEEDWAEVEIIGWLYQFYISEKKDQVIGKVVKSEDIPAATQLFTPNWIVQYLVQNSVGRLWLTANPASTLASQWPYYIQPAKQTPEVQAQLDALIQTRMDEDGGSLNPESITVLDPACGSGHILVVAYDVLKAIYLERGYQPRAIPRLVLEKNLYGLDIDDRAAQMAGFALLMKARADDRRLFNEPPKFNVLSLQDSKGLDAVELHRVLGGFTSTTASGAAARSEFEDSDLFPGSLPQMMLGESPARDDVGAVVTAGRINVRGIQLLIDTFIHAKTFGSLIKIPPAVNAQLPALTKVIQQALQSGDLYGQSAAQDLLPLVAQAWLLGMQFDAVVANPPYMSRRGMNSDLKGFILSLYPDSIWDIFSAFIFRNMTLSKVGAYAAFMTPQSWMSLSSHEALRDNVCSNALNSLIQLSYSGFSGAAVAVCGFVVQNFNVEKYNGSYIKLSDFNSPEEQDVRALQAINDNKCGWFYVFEQSRFSLIPGRPISYSAPLDLVNVFSVPTKISDINFGESLTLTGNNARFLRFWWEINHCSVGIGKKWLFYAKGGRFRKWYGNFDYVINWSKEAVAHYRSDKTARIIPEKNWYKAGISWTLVTSAIPSFRLLRHDAVYDVGGASILVDEINIPSVMAFLNSNLSHHLIDIVNPSVNLQIGDVSSLPFPGRDVVIDDLCVEVSKIAKNDWDAFEVSFDFSNFFFLQNTSSLKTFYDSYIEASRENTLRTAEIEKMINQHYTNYFACESVTSNVDIKSITLKTNPYYFFGDIGESDIIGRQRNFFTSNLISFSIGCMMGRYSLDEPGLIYAHAGNVGYDASRYATFPADVDGIVPLTDELWFLDDAASRVREFLLAVWGVDTIEESMAWLAESLDTKASETPDETIRRYLADKFFKDHLQTYKKRPIYWLFSSGKQSAFHALVYLHRYNESTLARMRSEYVVPLSHKFLSRIEILEKDAVACSSAAARTKIQRQIEALRKKRAELMTYDEKLRHYADMRIKIDLDDGVKVNYAKFGDLVAESKAVTGGNDE